MFQGIAQAVEDKIRGTLEGVHTAMPAVVSAIYPEAGKIDALPVGSFYCSGIEMAYPVIPGIPVVTCTSSEGVGFCFPIKEGDTVLLVFAEQSISAWMTETSEAQSDERFELFNAIAIPGLSRVFPEAQAMANEEGCAIMTAGESMVKAGPDGVSIKAASVKIESEEVNVTGRLRARTIYADTYQNLPY